MKNYCLLLIAVTSFVSFKTMNAYGQETVTTGSLIGEMTDLERLTRLSVSDYRSVQFSSYDRRSSSRDKPSWFANADGFGGEPIPGFEKVLKAADSGQAGEYLICDVKGPGAIVRFWTANMVGSIKLFLDGKEVYDGPAENFLWAFPDQFGTPLGMDYSQTLRQYDALYFPVAFAKSCRIEWKGDLKKRHFYQIGMRLYDKKVKVKTFHPNDIKNYYPAITKAIQTLADPENALLFSGVKQDATHIISKGQVQNIFQLTGSRAIELLKIKINPVITEMTLRQAVLRIYFDGASVPQIEAPVGDFFGAAPGVNPYQSFPLTVEADSTMSSRFIMPFKKSVKVQIENMSDQPIHLAASISTRPYEWDDQRSMYFRARWRIDHGLTTSTSGGEGSLDVPYLLSMGEGRLVGAACYLMNPAHAPSGNGSWWGEGDEKIYVDDHKTPSFFGTGSEDYYNYSWSTDQIFFNPYCGQPRNDGPANRGFVTNFRWHIIDDIPFKDKLAFYMELLAHTRVPGFVYGRMIYLYGREGMLDDHYTISKDDVRPVILPVWRPEAVRGSIPFRFLNAENAYKGKAATTIEYDPIWAGGQIFVWKPGKKGEKINLEVTTSPGKKNLMICLGHMPGSGKVRMYINGNPVPLKEKESVNLNEDRRILNRGYSSGNVDFLSGKNIVTLENMSEGNVKIGIDLLWIKD